MDRQIDFFYSVGAGTLMVSNFRLETKVSQFESSC